MKKLHTRMHDGSQITVEVHGQGPAVLLPLNPLPIDGRRAAEMRKWGADPALGKSFIDGLSDKFTVVAFGYEDHVLAHPKPNTLTPENIVRDFLAVADAAGVDRFAYYGYSWLGLGALQLATRTNRLWAVVMGGYPPLYGPYKEMLQVTTATYNMAKRPKKPDKPAAPAEGEEFDWSSVEITMSPDQTKQFVTLYEALQDFDDRAIQDKIICPRLCFAGSADIIHYGERWNNVTVDIAGPLLRHRTEIERLGWKVVVFDGLDHTRAMQAATVLPVIRPWLIEQGLAE
jgi:pimeloyl-ACP methyl ester carboxylesterase